MSFAPSFSTDEICVGTNTELCLTDELENIKNSIPESATGPQGPAGEDGEDGTTPHIGSNGNWFIGTTDTGVAATGPQGPQGETGATGPAGADGEDGATGPQGPKGDKGDKGDTGATGPQGPAGATGATGEKGDKGDKGDPFTYSDFTAAQLASLKGEKGDKGDTGATGATGAKGAKGDKGDKGDTGATGATGPQGPQGPAGADGQDFNGNLTGGILRLNGVQTAYNSGSQLIFGSNNCPTRIAGNAITATKTIQVDSDARLKNVFEVDMDKLRNFAKNVKLVAYELKDTPGVKRIGVVAQQLLEIDPEIARYFVFEDEKGFYSVDYTALSLLAILALQ